MKKKTEQEKFQTKLVRAQIFRKDVPSPETLGAANKHGLSLKATLLLWELLQNPNRSLAELAQAASFADHKPVETALDSKAFQDAFLEMMDLKATPPEFLAQFKQIILRIIRDTKPDKPSKAAKGAKVPNLEFNLPPTNK